MRTSVYTPGAGHRPQVLAGRDALLRQMSAMTNDVATSGRPRAQDLLLIGPRGVGKTATLSTFGAIAAGSGFEIVNLQAVAGRGGLVDAILVHASERIERSSGPWTRARRGFERIANIGVGVAGASASIGLNAPIQMGRVVDGNVLATALVDLANEVRRDRPTGGVLVTVDEMQVGAGEDLALLAATLHRLNVDHSHAAVMFAGTGLPHTPAVLRDAGVTHPDRLFVREDIPLTLSRQDAAYAITEPARRAGVVWDPVAVESIVDACNGYPAHLQLFAHEVWGVATGPTITQRDVATAIPLVQEDLTRRTLGPRWDYVTDRQAEYLAALSLLGGRTRTNAIGQVLGRSASELSVVRDALLREGDIYSLRRGEVALTVPVFRDFILDHYTETVARADLTLLTLEQMHANAPRPLPGPTRPRPNQGPLRPRTSP